MKWCAGATVMKRNGEVVGKQGDFGQQPCFWPVSRFSFFGWSDFSCKCRDADFLSLSLCPYIYTYNVSLSSPVSVLLFVFRL